MLDNFYPALWEIVQYENIYPLKNNLGEIFDILVSNCGVKFYILSQFRFFSLNNCFTAEMILLLQA